MIDLKKYAVKGVEVDNEDFKLEKLENDLLKGYVKESEVEKPDYSNYVSKADYDKLVNDYSSLEENYNSTIKKLDDTNEKMGKVSLESKMVRAGFKDEDFEEVSKLRYSIYGEEKDDAKAIENIANRYKATFFKGEEQFTAPPKESGSFGSATNSKEKETIRISRNTKISDLIIK